ncbi:MAG: type IV secretion system protein VirB11 [Candidatus Aenigmarchaeota archaeon]|nr:type IV secretion system protein VirB11 [Candidatus Aenigmarchaeota archaeon]
MKKIKLKHMQPKGKLKLKLSKFFWRTVRGYKILKKMELSGFGGRRLKGMRFPYPQESIMGGGRLEIKGPSVKISEIKAEKFVVGEEEEFKGIPIVTEVGTIVKISGPEYSLRDVNIFYDLIKYDSKVFASANIRWSDAQSSLIYKLIEPKLTINERNLLNKIKMMLIEKLDVDFTTLRKGQARSYLFKRFEEMITTMAPNIPEDKKKDFLYYIERDFVGLGKIEALMKDPNLEDISCDGVGVPLYVYHRDPLIGSVKTNIFFESSEELDVFVSKLSQRCGKSISVAQPLIGGTLPSGSRVQATLGTDIARKGSNFTIRKFTEKPLTPVNLLNLQTLDPKIAAYLWLTVEYGRSILISGGVATGKTTLLNAMSLFIKPELKIVSIEDTAELLLPHSHWVPSVARLPIVEIGRKKLGEVDLFDLLKESLRQRPDYLIVGEVRGREAYVLFQQIATGHSSLSTIHADSMERLIDRLTTPPISLPANLIEALDIIIFLVRIKYGPTYVRRIRGIYEIVGFDKKKNFPIVNEIFRWNPNNDSYDAVNPSIVLKRISQQHGIKQVYLQQEISRRIKILEWMTEKNIEDYRDVAKISKLYYARPDELLEAIP